MNKRALLLSAAFLALLSSPAFAVTCDGPATTATLCDIKSVVTTTIATSNVQSSPSDITIEGTGAINVTTAAAPALKIDSDNNVINNGTISNKNTSNAIGVEIIAGHDSTNTTTVATYNGAIFLGTSTSVVSIDLTGTGTGKTGILIAPVTTLGTGTVDATATSAADIANNIAPGILVGSMNVVGDNSYGVHLLSGVTLEGPLSIDGPVSVKSSTSGAGSSTGVVGVEVDGNITGNLNIAPVSIVGGSVVATGAGARGVVVLGSIGGAFYNGGTIEALGASSSSSSTTKTSTTGNPQAGSAVTIAGSVTGGIYNAGPDSSTSATATAQIFSQGIGPAFLISSAQNSGSPVEIGIYTGTGSILGGNFSFYNRGQISTQPANVNTGSVGMRISGTSGQAVTFDGGLFNSGLIGASGATDSSGPSQGIPVTALWIDDFTTIPTLVNSNVAGSGHGNIQASVSGASPAQAIAILINKDTNGSGSLGSIINSGSITATAATSDTKISTLNAIAIDDLAGSLTSITNTGLISATTTTLDDNHQSHVALNTSTNTHDVDFENSGTVLGDVIFGSGQDILHVSGTSSAPASVTGNINFNGSNGTGNDTLTLDNYATVVGAVLESGGGYVNTSVGTGGNGTSLIVNNTDFAGNTSVDKGTFEVGTLDVKSGATLGITLSQGFNQAINASNPALISGANAGASNAHINIESGANLVVSFGSFVSTPGGDPARFTLLDAPLGDITIANQTAIATGIESSIPFLFTGNVCQYNISGGGIDACSGTNGDSALVINLQPKTAQDLQLSGNAKQIFTYANTALANDNTLGSAVVAAGSPVNGVSLTDAVGNALYQDIYSQFAPDVSGGGRAIAVSLTDEATSALGARQRVLRMYASKESAATLWGQEFAQDLSNGTNTPNGFHDSGFGFAVGADGGSLSSGRYGAAFTFFSGDVLEKTPAQVKTSTEWYMLSGYTDWRGKGLFFDSQVTVGYGSLTGKRSLFVRNSAGGLLLERTATNKRASLLGAAGFSTGTVMNMGTLVVMPQFSMDALTMRENGYQETGGGNAFDMTVDPYYAKSLRSYLGSTFRDDVNLGGFFLQPEARIGYRYDFLADPIKLDTRFTGDPAASIPAGAMFTLAGPAPAKGSFVAGAGLAATTGSWSLGLNYDLLNGGGLTQQTGTITLVGRL